MRLLFLLYLMVCVSMTTGRREGDTERKSIAPAEDDGRGSQKTHTHKHTHTHLHRQTLFHTHTHTHTTKYTHTHTHNHTHTICINNTRSIPHPLTHVHTPRTIKLGTKP